MGRPVAGGVLTDVERETLLRWSRRAKSSQALALRSRIVLGCAEGKANKQVAAELGVWPQTVGTWRRRFVESRLDGLVDEPRPGAPRKITDEHRDDLAQSVRLRGPAKPSDPRLKPEHQRLDLAAHLREQSCTTIG